MNEHRWISTITVPCKVQRNEDADTFVRADPTRDLMEYPMHLWCYDCETSYEEVFGQPCEGVKNGALSDEWWTRIL